MRYRQCVRSVKPNSLNRIRTGNKKRVRQEMSGIFHTKRPKSSSKVFVWKHKFWLTRTSIVAEANKEELHRAGLSLPKRYGVYNYHH